MTAWKTYIKELIRYLFIVLLLYAAVYKLIEYPKFYESLLNSPVFKMEVIVVFISWFTPILELVTAGLLISKSYRKTGIYIAFTLILLFTIYIAGILLFSQEIPCSCGGIINNLTWNEHLIFNIGFVLLGAIGMYLKPNKI